MSYTTDLQTIITNNTAKLATLSSTDAMTVRIDDVVIDMGKYREQLMAEIEWAKQQLSMNQDEPVESVHQVQ